MDMQPVRSDRADPGLRRENGVWHMAWILDIGVVVIVAVCMIVGRRRGVVRTVVGLAGFAVSAIASWLLGSWVSPYIFQTFLRPQLVESMEKTLAGSVDAAAAIAKLPGYVTRFFSADTLAAQVQQAVDAGAAQGAQLLADHVLEPVMVMFIRAVVTLVLFVVLMIVMRLVARAANLIAKLPVLRQLNRGLGLALGAVKGALIVLLAAALLRAAAPFTPPQSLAGTETIEKTVIFEWIYEHNPLFAEPSTADKA